MIWLVGAVVEVDLSAPSFKPGKAGYGRVKRCLSELNLQADFVLAWDSKGQLCQNPFPL